MRTDRLISGFYSEAANQWADLAVAMEPLEREPVYRIIRARSD
ncbi:hypothetical protein [Bradyrhizobium sp. CCBAU 51627]|nr:hypothetical protein [Bradyrhizobium sp. CCBAU 51627]